MWNEFIDLFRQSTAMLTFLSIFAAGLVVTLFSLAFGGDHDHGDVGHDHGGDHDEGGGHLPNIFSVRGLSLFATGFGGVGLIVLYIWKQVLVASLCGLGFGWVFAILGLSMMRMLTRQQSNSLVQPEAYIGAIGTVTTSIPERGLGEVLLTIAGSSVTRSASSVAGKEIPAQAAVRVKSVLGGTVSVEEVA